MLVGVMTEVKLGTKPTRQDNYMKLNVLNLCLRNVVAVAFALWKSLSDINGSGKLFHGTNNIYIIGSALLSS